MEFHHVSVLLNETIENLNIRPEADVSGRNAGRRGTRLSCMQQAFAKRQVFWDRSGRRRYFGRRRAVAGVSGQGDDHSW